MHRQLWNRLPCLAPERPVAPRSSRVPMRSHPVLLPVRHPLACVLSPWTCHVRGVAPRVAHVSGVSPSAACPRSVRGASASPLPGTRARGFPPPAAVTDVWDPLGASRRPHARRFAVLAATCWSRGGSNSGSAHPCDAFPVCQGDVRVTCDLAATQRCVCGGDRSRVFATFWHRVPCALWIPREELPCALSQCRPGLEPASRSPWRSCQSWGWSPGCVGPSTCPEEWVGG